MATKTKVTKETVLKESAAITPHPAPAKKSGEKTKNIAGLAPEIASGEVHKSTKTPPKAKSQTLSALQEPTQDITTQTGEKPSTDVAPLVKAVVDVVVSPAQSGATHDKKWQEIGLILEKLKEATLREIRKSVKNGTEAVAAIEPGGDIYDQASSERDRELGLLLGDREREKIHSIDEALLRIEEGDYGICEECDEDIPLGRLKAMPFTRHCVKCKSDLEKLQAQTKRVEEERAYREIPLGAEEEES